MSEKVKLTKQMIVNDLNEGLTRDEMAEKYGIPKLQMRQAVKELGLTKKRAIGKMYQIVDDAATEPNQDIPTSGTVEED